MSRGLQGWCLVLLYLYVLLLVFLVMYLGNHAQVSKRHSSKEILVNYICLYYWTMSAQSHRIFNVEGTLEIIWPNLSQKASSAWTVALGEFGGLLVVAFKNKTKGVILILVLGRKSWKWIAVFLFLLRAISYTITSVKSQT